MVGVEVELLTQETPQEVLEVLDITVEIMLLPWVLDKEMLVAVEWGQWEEIVTVLIMFLVVMVVSEL
jgi:hypothetical protein